MIRPESISPETRTVISAGTMVPERVSAGRSEYAPVAVPQVVAMSVMAAKPSTTKSSKYCVAPLPASLQVADAVNPLKKPRPPSPQGELF